MQVQSLGDVLGLRKKRVPAGLSPAPQLSGGLPLLGHSVEFIRSTIELLARAQRELGEVAAFTVFNRKMVAMFGPEAHEAVFRAPDAILSPSEAYKIMTPVFGKDIVYDAPPEKMAEQLKMLLPALKDKRMRTYGEAVVLETEKNTAEWGEAGVIDFVDFCRVLTNFTSSRCLLGKEFREGMTEEFAAVYHDLEKGVTPLAYINAHLPIPSFRKRDKARVRMVEMITGVIRARLRDRRQGEDFLQTLMEARYSDGRALSENEITGMLLAGMFAGHHTSSVTTAWTLIELLRNPGLPGSASSPRSTASSATARRSATRALRELTRDGERGQGVAAPASAAVHARARGAAGLHVQAVRSSRRARGSSCRRRCRTRWSRCSRTRARSIPIASRRRAKRTSATSRTSRSAAGATSAWATRSPSCRSRRSWRCCSGSTSSSSPATRSTPTSTGSSSGRRSRAACKYRRRAQPSVTMNAAAELSKMASPEAMTAAMEMHGGTRAHANGTHGTATAPRAAKAPAKKLKIMLDRDLCQGHAVCVGEAPDVFRIGEDGKVELALDGDLPLSLYGKVHEAAQYCPTRTIKLRYE